MDAIDTVQPLSRRLIWWRRLRAAVAVLLLWAALHFVAGARVLSGGLDRPTVVLVGDGGIAAAVTVLLLAVAGALLATVLCGRRDGTQGLLIVALALALWAFWGGTADDWLIARNPSAGPPTGAAYWPLLAETLYWTLVVLAVVALNAVPFPWFRGQSTEQDWPRALGLDLSPPAARRGAVALLITVVAAALLIGVLMGPRLGHTYHGQVYFAVAVAFALGTLLGRRVAGVWRPAWYLPGPMIVAVIGVVWAGLRPGLGPGYEHINVIPACGLARALPVEMVAVGTAAILLTLRTARRLSSGAGG